MIWSMKFVWNLCIVMILIKYLDWHVWAENVDPYQTANVDPDQTVCSWSGSVLFASPSSSFAYITGTVWWKFKNNYRVFFLGVWIFRIFTVFILRLQREVWQRQLPESSGDPVSYHMSCAICRQGQPDCVCVQWEQDDTERAAVWWGFC